jgi:maltooligosyltrehalose trehalohydrolase
MRIGAEYASDDSCEFTFWAPEEASLELHLLTPQERIIPLTGNHGYWKASLRDVVPGTLYQVRFASGVEYPDPASHSQPQGVHAASEVVNHAAFVWNDQHWTGMSLQEMVMTAIELMPVAQFPGERNWGYDGVYPFAVQHSYGGPDGLKGLVNACHRHGMALILDVVYNHLGPEGNYLGEFGPYFTEKYKTPWGKALNFDGPESDHVRNFFIQNALFFLEQYHVDAFRLDAVHAIVDASAYPFLQELADKIRDHSSRVGRKIHLIAESNLNDTRIIRPPDQGGFGHDAQWCDDFHHAVHTLMTGEQKGYYADYGKPEHLVKCLREGFVYSGEYSRFRRRRHGNSSADIPAQQFVVCTKSHDQIGNRMMGERMTSLVSFEAVKLHMGITLLSPFVPMIFMGEEFAADEPFLYFVSHTDPALITAVRKGRKDEFRSFQWNTEPPDPQDRATFERSRIRWEKRDEGTHKTVLDFCRELLSLRRSHSALARLDKNSLDIYAEGRVIIMRRWDASRQLLLTFSFEPKDTPVHLRSIRGTWNKILDSADTRWQGPGSLLPPTWNGATELTLRAWSIGVFSQ